MNREIKQLLIIWVIVFALCILSYILIDRWTTPVERVDRIDPSNSLVCPAGTRGDGDGCRIEPTGCPYGDSIPLEDCYKDKSLERLPVINQRGGK